MNKKLLIFITVLVVLFDIGFAAKLYLTPKVLGESTAASPNTSENDLEYYATPTETQQELQNIQEAPEVTNDPDPVVTCNSKTGKLQVKRSVCISYTDCPDGNGGFIFESQDSCKARYQAMSNNLKAAVDSYVQTIKSSMIQPSSNYPQIPDYTSNLPQYTPVPTIGQEIKDTSPSKCPRGVNLAPGSPCF